MLSQDSGLPSASQDLVSSQVRGPASPPPPPPPGGQLGGGGGGGGHAKVHNYANALAVNLTPASCFNAYRHGTISRFPLLNCQHSNKLSRLGKRWAAFTSKALGARYQT